MIRKAGKLPNATTGPEYFKEYKGGMPTGGDKLCAPKAACKAGDRCMVIDDLMATGVRRLNVFYLTSILISTNTISVFFKTRGL